MARHHYTLRDINQMREELAEQNKALTLVVQALYAEFREMRRRIEAQERAETAALSTASVSLLEQSA